MRSRQPARESSARPGEAPFREILDIGQGLELAIEEPVLFELSDVARMHIDEAHRVDPSRAE